MAATDRIEALEAQVAKLTAAVMTGDPLTAAQMLAEPKNEPEAPVADEEPAA